MREEQHSRVANSGRVQDTLSSGQRTCRQFGQRQGSSGQIGEETEAQFPHVRKQIKTPSTLRTCQSSHLRMTLAIITTWMMIWTQISGSHRRLGPHGLQVNHLCLHLACLLRDHLGALPRKPTRAGLMRMRVLDRNATWHGLALVFSIQGVHVH